MTGLLTLGQMNVSLKRISDFLRENEKENFKSIPKDLQIGGIVIKKISSSQDTGTNKQNKGSQLNYLLG